MPPRIQPLCQQLARPSLPTPSITSSPLPFAQCLYRDFSTSSVRAGRTGRISQARRAMFRWLEGPGRQLRFARPGTTNYLGAYDRTGRFLRGSRAGRPRNEDEEDMENEDQEDGDKSNQDIGLKKVKSNLPPETQEDLRPFPLNPFFRSEPVLSEELRHEIYKRVVEKKQSVREVSIALNVEMARVGAVVRLITIEKDWVKKGQELASVYQAATLAMLPTTPYDPSSSRLAKHESINDLPVHPATLPQIFHPTSESRQFTRVDAGKVFKSGLLPADARIPHPEMIETIKDRNNGMNAREQRETQEARIAAMNHKRREAQEKKLAKLEKKTTIVPGKRWDFKFVDCKVEDAGKLGRGVKAPGWRYGFPHEDRKKGQTKIATSVPA